MNPIWAYNKKLKSWELFPGHLLEPFENGLQGFDRNYWYPPRERSDQVEETLNKYRKHFARQHFSNHGPCRYVFLPGLPRLTRCKLKVQEKWEYVLENRNTQYTGNPAAGISIPGNGLYHRHGDNSHYQDDLRNTVMLKPTPRCRRRRRKRTRAYLVAKYLRGELIFTQELNKFILRSSYWGEVWPQAIIIRVIDPEQAKLIGAFIPDSRHKNVGFYYGDIIRGLKFGL